MSDPLMQILTMGNAGREQRIAPELLKRLKKFSLNAMDISSNLKRFRGDAFVIGRENSLQGSELTPGKMYPIDDVEFNEKGTAILVTVTDDQQLMHRSEVLLVDTLSAVEEAQSKPSGHSLILILEEVRSLLASKWASETISHTDRLIACFELYKKPLKFSVGELVVYKENMMLSGVLPRRGVGIVAESLDLTDAKRDPKSRELHDTLVAYFDDDGDLVIMPVFSGRLQRVPLNHVGSYTNPFVSKKHRKLILDLLDQVEEDTETSDS